MNWLVFSIAGAFIGGFAGLAVCGCSGAGSGDSTGAVVALLFAAVGGGIGLLAGTAGAGVVAAADAIEHESSIGSQSEPENAEEWIQGGALCPHSGLWVAQVADGHPLAGTFNTWDRTARVIKGKRFPDPSKMVTGVTAADVQWRWIEAFNEAGHTKI